MSTLSDLIGHVLDEKYRIEKQLGQGGMGAVFLATHIGTERPVALKVIMPEYMTDGQFVERFKREAKAAGRLRHPNVVNVTDFGFAPFGPSRLAYLVMEYLNGCSLGDLLEKKGRLPIGFVVDIVEQVCLAIDQAHKVGIIHRDLKPDNIWLQPDGRGGYIVKALDFGLAKLHSRLPTDIADFTTAAALSNKASYVDPDAKTMITRRDEEKTVNEDETATVAQKTPIALQRTVNSANGAGVAEKLTYAGAILGTPLYMSPEQCRGENIDSRSDIYSLGVIVYEMLAGKTPFDGNLRELIKQHIEAPPPALDAKRLRIPESAARFIISTLSKDPNDRPKTALAFAVALRADAEGETPILRESFDICRKNFSAFARLSFCLYLPYLLLNCLLAAAALTPMETMMPGQIAGALRQSYWPLSFALILFANSVNGAAFASAVERLRRSPQNNIKIRPILADFRRKFGALASAALLGYLKALLHSLKLLIPGLRAYIDHSLLAPVIMMEEARGKATLERSKSLADRLRQPLISIQARSIFISSMALLASPVIFALFGMLSTVISDGSIEIAVKREGAIPAFIFIPLALATVPWLFITLLQPFTATAVAIFYFKVREAVGETLSENVKQDFELPEENRPSNSTFKRTAILTTVLAASLVGWIGIRDIALTFASASGSIGTVEALLTVGADANSKTTLEFLSRFETTPLIGAVGNGNIDIAKILIDKGADPSVANQYGWTPLMEAVKQGREDLAALLVEKGADPNAKNNFGWTPLMWAADRGNPDLIELLLDSGADANAANDDGETALILAALGGHAYAVKPLLDAGADINATTGGGETALSIAERGGDTYIVKLLSDKFVIE